MKQKSFHPQELNEQFTRTSNNLSLPVTKKQSVLPTMGIMHTFGSKVDISGMPIGPCRPRLRSIDWSAMPYSSSWGVHPRPTIKHRKIAASLWWSKNPFTPKNQMNNLQELQRTYISPSQRNNQCHKQWGSFTIRDQRWIARECQLARADRDRDRSISLQCHTARHEVCTHVSQQNIRKNNIMDGRSSHLWCEAKIASPWKT